MEDLTSCYEKDNVKTTYSSSKKTFCGTIQTTFFEAPTIEIGALIVLVCDVLKDD